MKTPSFSACLISAGTAFALAGCGGEEPTQAKKGPTERLIYVSAPDCEAGGKYSLDDCSAAIQKAIQFHDKKSPTYKSQGTCEETEGLDKCERVGDKNFRPRLVAYAFDDATPLTAKPLYLIKEGTPGFRVNEKDMLLEKDDNLIFSKSAKDLSELHVKKK